MSTTAQVLISIVAVTVGALLPWLFLSILWSVLSSSETTEKKP